jgi:uncharacterized membrane protein SirB2
MIDAAAAPGDLLTTLRGQYPLIKQLHVTLVALSGALFALRGAAVLARASWPMRAAARWSSVIIDTLLLTAGATLWGLLGLNPVRDGWLGLKLALLLAYIVVGSVALKRGRTARVRGLAFAVALGLYLFIVSVALAHHPLGLLAPKALP